MFCIQKCFHFEIFPKIERNFENFSEILFHSKTFLSLRLDFCIPSSTIFFFFSRRPSPTFGRTVTKSEGEKAGLRTVRRGYSHTLILSFFFYKNFGDEVSTFIVHDVFFLLFCFGGDNECVKFMYRILPPPTYTTCPNSTPETNFQSEISGIMSHVLREYPKGVSK